MVERRHVNPVIGSSPPLVNFSLCSTSKSVLIISVYTLPDLVYTISASFTTPDCNVQQSSVFKQQLGTHLHTAIIAIDVSFQISNLVALCVGGVPGAVARSHPVMTTHGTILLVKFDLVVRHKMIAECSSSCMIGEMDQRTALVS